MKAIHLVDLPSLNLAFYHAGHDNLTGPSLSRQNLEAGSIGRIPS